jgi:gliding motility-associated-like protein
MKKIILPIISYIFFDNIKKFIFSLFFLASTFLSAQDIGLFQQFNGNYDFTAIGNTLNTGPNGCNILTTSQAELDLDPGLILIAARLYWSGSGAEFSNTYPGDYQVTLNGTPVSADERHAVSSFIGIDFYGASADVTNIVNTNYTNGNGLYTLSDLDLTGNIFPGSDYCQSTVDYGGWSIIVIYEDPTLPLNQISLFDGLEVVYQNELIITLGPLDVASDQLAKIGFLAWEGDLPNPNNESLRINGVLINDPPLNPGNNQFNGTNSYTNSTNLYNMDLDVYDLDGLIDPGDTEIEIKITSDSDLVLIHNIITSVNSELPDATISFEEITFICNNTVDLNYTVFNVNSTGSLPAGTPIKFYLEGNQIGQAVTNTILPINGDESGIITLTIPTGTVPDPFTVLAVVDDGGGGVSTVTETNEDNNEFQQIINLADVTLSVVLDPDILIANSDAICDGEDQVIGIDSLTPPGVAGTNSTYQWFFNGVIIPGATNDQLTVTQAGTYELEVTYGGCNVIDDILVEYITNPVPGTPNPLIVCDEVPNDGEAVFTLTDADADIINGQTGVFVTYYLNQIEADLGDPLDELVSPYTYTTPDTQTIVARLEENILGCYATVDITLIVNDAPAIADPIIDYPLCDNDQDGTENFDLTSKYNEIINTLSDIILTYYNTAADANLGDPANAIPIPTSYTSAGGETIWVNAVNLEGCTTVGSFNLVIPTVTITEVPLFQVCDDDTPDGITEFDLESQTPTIVAGDTNLVVTYHLTEADAEAGTTPSLSSPYTNTINPEPVWVRVEDTTTTGCYVAFEMQLNVISPIAGTPDLFVLCDEVPNDGFARFDLFEADDSIINGQSDMLVTYHLTLIDAEAGAPFLPISYTNTTPTNQTIFARLNSLIINGCYDIIELVLQVDAAPSITDPISEYPLCDNNEDGTEIFDLTSKYDEIVNTLSDITLTYYNTEFDAIEGRNAILTPTTYTSAGAETIWVLAVNLEGCVTVSSFELIIDTVPTYTEVPLFQVCDDDTPDGLTEFDLDSQNIDIATVGGVFNPDLTVTYHLEQTDAEAGTTPSLSSPYTNSVNPEFIWLRVEDDITGCYGAFQIELNVISPIAGNPTPLVECDEFPNDGAAEFDLSNSTLLGEIINGQVDMAVTFHLTLPEAQAGTPVLSSPYNSSIQPIFARLQSTIPGFEDCYDTISLDLIVNPAPAIADPISEYPLCDNDEDGTEDFDLTNWGENEILNGLTNVTLTYYITPTDADLGDPVNEIPTPTAYTSAGTETIWVRAVNLEGCVTVSSFELIIDTVPIFTEVPLFQVCDDDTPDGITEFDLESQTPTIVAGDTNLIVTYHLTEADAEAGTTPSLSSPYTNTINPEPIWVRVEDAITGCYGDFQMELLVNPLPTPVVPADFIECDEDNDGEIAFDLALKDTEIIGGQPGVLITYHETIGAAQAGTPVLVSPYTNTSGPIQTIFARAEFTATGCFDIVPMNLVVNPTPIIPTTITPIEICDINLDLIEDFDLTDRADQIYGTQSTSEYALTYYTDPIDADSGTGEITTPNAYQNTSVPQTIWVRLENIITECYSVGSFNIDFIFCALPDATIVIDNIGVLCSDSNLDVTYTVFNNTVTGGILPANTPIAFYADGVLLGTENTINPIAVNGNEVATTSLFIPVGTPFIFTLTGVVDDDGTGLGIVGEENETNNEFDIEINLDGETINLGPDIESCIGYTVTLDADLGEPGFNYQWFLNGTLIPGATDPLLDVSGNGFYRIEAVNGACFVFGEINVNFNAPPIAVTDTSLNECDQVTNDGFAEFTLNEADDQIRSGLDGAVTYYLTESDAEAGTPVLPNSYTNVEQDTQTVFARFEEDPYGCYDVVELILKVNAAPAITDPIPDYFICDNDQNNNEDFDLTFWGNTEIVNTLNDITLTYYTTLADAGSNDLPPTNQIPTPTAYPSAGGETIWVRAENNLTSCTTVSSFDLISGMVPVYVEVPLFPLCDDDTPDGITVFDLESQNATIINGDANLIVTYHLIQTDAESGTNPLISPYTNTVNPETIYVRVEDTTTGCYITFEMLLDVVSPIAVVPDDLNVCDEVPNDGFAEFTLTDADTQIINGQPDTFVRYYLTEPDADAGSNPLTSPYTNTTPNTQIVFARLEETLLSCYDVVPMTLRVDTAPAITNPISDYFICDNDQDSLEIFDLTSKYLEIVNTLSDITLVYYNLEADANTETNPIATPDSYTSAGGETIWVRAENSFSAPPRSCTTIGSFNLVIGIVPLYVEVPLFELCDDGISDGFTTFDLESQNATIINGDTNLIVTYHLIQTDAESGTNPLMSPYTNTVDPETIYVRVEDATTGCYGLFEMLLDVISPIAEVPDPLEYCDPANDGFGEFTLTDADSQVTGGIPTGNLQVSYHYLLEDAQNGANPLASPYLNDVPFNQTVFVRLLDQTTGCYSTTTLELIVLESPQIIQPMDLELCDEDGDGITVFDLTVVEGELLNGLDPLLYTIIYYEDAGLTIPITNPVAYVNIPPSPQTIYIVVTDNLNGCKSQTILLLWVYIPPVLVAPLPYDLCDVTDIIGPDDEFEPFDLESKTPEITGGDLTISVTYHATQAEADAGTNALVSPYINTANPQTIFLRAENTNGDNDLTCFVSLGVTLDLVVNPLPSPITPTPLEVCDIDNDGIAEFMLTDKDDEIIGGEPGVVVTYHETLLNAESGTLALASPYTNIDTYVQIVYVRAEYSLALGGTGCFRVVALELKTSPTPIIDIDLPALVECADGDFTVFNLTDQADFIYGTQDPLDYTLTYYTDPIDAAAGVNAIANPSAFTNTSNPQIIWVRLDDNSTDCLKVGSFELVVELVPIFTLVPTFDQCDDEVQDGFTEFDLNTQNFTITGSDPTLGVTYHATQDDADAGSNPLVIPYTNVVNPETVFVRVESGVTGCYGTFTMELVVIEAPTIIEPAPLEYCDPDNDGFGEFMLTDADLDITGGVPIGNLQVSYHYLLEDAQNGVLPLPTAVFYLNDVPFLQTVYVRLVDQTTGCYNITTLDLIVLDSPQIISPADMTLCDDDGDGIEVFDLTLSEPELLSTADPAGGPYSISYYEDAALTISIANPTAYSNIPPSPQTVYIVVEGIPNGCRSETTLVLWVVAAPTIFPPTALELCDIITQDDGFEPFDLESKTDEITGGNLSIDVTYYETQPDADAGTNALLSPYINTANPQTIFIRAEDLDTSCIVSQGITLSLVVNPLPSPVTPTPLEVCDIDNDGFASFMLTDKDTEIIGGEPGVLVSYYETYLDAEAGIFALTSPYINIVSPSQIIYTRAEFPLPPVGTGTGCFRIVELELIVNPTPIIPLDIPALVVCDDDGDGFSIFDLTDQEGIIYGTQNPADYTLTYYISELDATDATNPIAVPTAFANTSNPQTIWVRLENTSTTCIKIGSFDIVSELGPLVIQPTPLTSCDYLGEPNDGLTLFDLTLKNAEITGGALGVRVDYYETLAEAEADTNVIDPDTAYQNTSNPQTIWVRVTDVNTFCFNTSVYLTLRVAANPDPEDPDPIILCDVNDPGDGEEVFDLTIREPQILDGETWDVSYYTSYQDAVDNNAAIALPTAYTNSMNPELVYVRVSIDLLDARACFEIVELELIVNPLPDDTAVISPYIICEIPSDGEAVFDLSTKIGEILNGQDPFIFEVLFYESQAEADLMINAIQNPTTYVNTGNPQTIYVVILNTDTDCFVSTQSFDIEVREGAVANTPLEPYAICDYWNENDGIAEFDLLNQDLLDEILGAQDPLVYQLDFYGTLENAELEVSPLPTTYVNIINPQIIYARVTNINTECYDITQVILKVELIPELALDEFYRLCVDAFGNPIPAEEGSASPPVIDTGLDPSIYMFEWQLDAEVLLGEIGASITVLQEGVYTVTVTEILTGCMSSATTTVITSSPPLIYSAEVTDAFASEHTITATADGIGDYEFQLDDNPFQESGVFLDVAPGNHLITIKDINGCGSVIIAVGVIDYPQFMTPNEDGYHDTWNIIGIANGDPTAKIYIFDRYGKLLKQLSTFSEGWDGSYNGNPMPSSDYWFRVEYTENDTKKEFSGHFTLKR